LGATTEAQDEALKDRVDDLSKRVRGLEQMEKRELPGGWDAGLPTFPYRG